MFSPARRGASALRSFRPVSLSVPTSSAVKFTRFHPSARAALLPVRASRPFSVIPHRFQQTAIAETSQEDAPPDFTTFEQLAESGLISQGVIDTITRQMNIHEMTEVQRMTLNQCLDGQDVIAQARTGTGKTIAFLLPIIQRILRANPALESRSGGRGAKIDIKGLIISPTRELAEQIAVEANRLTSNTGIKVQTAVGGTQKNYHLRNMVTHGCHLLVGTPGRVNDILSDPRSGVNLDNIETFVLDEADRLLDIGFAPAIEEIQSYMPNRAEVPRQTLMFSATVPKSVVSLVRETMRPNFKFVRTVDPNEAPTHERVPQKVVFLQGLENQAPAILEIAMNAIEAHKKDPVNNMPFKAIVYYGSTNEVDMAYTIFDNMRDQSDLRSGSRFAPHPLSPTKLYRMNGKLDQRVRTRESQGFRHAESALLFSSDVTARGMDFPNVSHVIQMGLPKNADDYIHRIGRTGRAGKSGEGWLLLNEDERRAYHKRMSHPGLKLEELDLPTGTLDMTHPAQVPAPVAKLLRLVEAGVRNVPYSLKRSVYASLLGVLQQQFPDRQRQDQINMMNDLARYGWGLESPPPLPRALVRKVGYEGCSGIVYDKESVADRYGGPPSTSRRAPRRDQFDENDPFNMGQSGKGVFGGRRGGDRDSGRDAFDDFPPETNQRGRNSYQRSNSSNERAAGPISRTWRDRRNPF